MSDPPIISVAGLRVRYGEREILHGITFDVAPGETLVVLGGSGSGKSTLLRTLIGLEKPFAGEVKIKGIDIARAGSRERDALRKRIGLAFQGGALIGSLSVAELSRCPWWSTRAWRPAPSKSWCALNWNRSGSAGLSTSAPRNSAAA